MFGPAESVVLFTAAFATLGSIASANPAKSAFAAVLLRLNTTPGPPPFAMNPDVVWNLIAALFIADCMLLVGFDFAGGLLRKLDVPSVPVLIVPGPFGHASNGDGSFACSRFAGRRPWSMLHRPWRGRPAGKAS